MFRKTLYSTFLLGLMLLLQQCFQPIEPLTTELAAKIVNAQGQALAGAKVYLFRSELFFNTRTNVFAEGITNSEGIVVFEDLDAENYFVYATYEEGERALDNGEESYLIANLLVGNSITYINVPLKDARPVRPTKLVLEKVFVTHGSNFLNGADDFGYDILVRENAFFGAILGNSEFMVGYSPIAANSSFIPLERVGVPRAPLTIDIDGIEDLTLFIQAIGTPSTNIGTLLIYEDLDLLTSELNVSSSDGPAGLRRLAYPRFIRYSFSQDGFIDVYLRWE